MMRLLERLLIGQPADIRAPNIRRIYGFLSGCAGLVFNLLLFAIKYLTGRLTGSISVTADAFNNLSDAATALMMVVGFRLASQKADAGHPFGHGRIEYLTGLFVSVSVILMGFELARTSVGRILQPVLPVWSGLTVAVLCVSIAVKLYMYLYNRRFAKKLDSEALRSTAADSMSDCVATFTVLLGQIAAHLTGAAVDGWVGLMVSVFILYEGVRAAIDTANPLIGRAQDPELTRQIRETVESVPGILGVHDLIIHEYGPNRRMVSLHAELDSGLSLMDAHELVDRIEMRLDAEYSLESVIHLDPVDRNDEEVRVLQGIIETWLPAIDPKATIHDLRLVREKTAVRVLFDIDVPFRCPRSDEDIRTMLKARLKDQGARYRGIIRVDRG